MPLISIIIPIYNVEKYLSECLDSILNQAVDDFELICINDGSTDNSLSIISEYMKNYDSKIVLIQQMNQGLSAARNAGIKAAKGKYICFVDSDDMLTTNALSILANKIIENPDVELFQFETAPLLFENGKEDANKINYYSVRSTYDEIQSGAKLFVNLMKNDDFVESANILLIKRDWLISREILFTPNALYEDSIFTIDCFFKCNQVMHISERLYVYRIREDSIMTSKYTFKQLKWRIWQYREILRRMCIYELSDIEENALSEYARMVLGSVKEIYISLSISEISNVSELGGMDKLIAESIGISIDEVFNEQLRWQGLIRLIEKSDHILIYGAGNIGSKLYEIIRNLELEDKILGYAVSRTSEKFELNHLPIKQIGQYAGQEINLIIIASIKDHDEMIETANNIGADYIAVIDSSLEHAMDGYIRNRVI